MRSPAARALLVLVGVAVVAVAATLYISRYLRSPTPFAAAQTGPHRASLTLGTTPAVGKLGHNPSWVSYLVRTNGHWDQTTVFDVPAHSLVHVTIYNFDGGSGLRNPFLSQVQGTVGGDMRVNGKATKVIPPDDASHTFSVPQFGLSVPIKGVADDAPHQCAEMPCPSTRRTRRSPSRSAPGSRGGIAGSASCPAPPDSSTGSRGRCRRSATWTASST